MKKQSAWALFALVALNSSIVQATEPYNEEDAFTTNYREYLGVFGMSPDGTAALGSSYRTDGDPSFRAYHYLATGGLTYLRNGDGAYPHVVARGFAGSTIVGEAGSSSMSLNPAAIGSSWAGRGGALTTTYPLSQFLTEHLEEVAPRSVFRRGNVGGKAVGRWKLGADLAGSYAPALMSSSGIVELGHLGEYWNTADDAFDINGSSMVVGVSDNRPFACQFQSGAAGASCPMGSGLGNLLGYEGRRHVMRGISDTSTCQPTVAVGQIQDWLQPSAGRGPTGFYCNLVAGPMNTLVCSSGLRELPRPAVPASKIRAGHPAVVVVPTAVSPSGKYIAGYACGGDANGLPTGCDTLSSASEQLRYFGFVAIWDSVLGLYTMSALDNLVPAEAGGAPSRWRVLSAQDVNDYGDVGAFACRVPEGSPSSVNCGPIEVGTTYHSIKISPPRRVAPLSCKSATSSVLLDSSMQTRCTGIDC